MQSMRKEKAIKEKEPKRKLQKERLALPRQLRV